MTRASISRKRSTNTMLLQKSVKSGIYSHWMLLRPTRCLGAVMLPIFRPAPLESRMLPDVPLKRTLGFLFWTGSWETSKLWVGRRRLALVFITLGTFAHRIGSLSTSKSFLKCWNKLSSPKVCRNRCLMRMMKLIRKRHCVDQLECIDKNCTFGGAVLRKKKCFD